MVSSRWVRPSFNLELYSCSWGEGGAERGSVLVRILAGGWVRRGWTFWRNLVLFWDEVVSRGEEVRDWEVYERLTEGSSSFLDLVLDFLASFSSLF